MCGWLSLPPADHQSHLRLLFSCWALLMMTRLPVCPPTISLPFMKHAYHNHVAMTQQTAQESDASEPCPHALPHSSTFTRLHTNPISHPTPFPGTQHAGPRDTSTRRHHAPLSAARRRISMPTITVLRTRVSTHTPRKQNTGQVGSSFPPSYSSVRQWIYVDSRSISSHASNKTTLWYTKPE